MNTRRHPDAPAVDDPSTDPRLAEGIHLFNEGHHWHAHEAWEPLWMGLEGDDKLFLQGLIMAAALLHQYHRGITAGVLSHHQNVLRRVPPVTRWGIDAAALLADLEALVAPLRTGSRPHGKPTPQLRRASI